MFEAPRMERLLSVINVMGALVSCFTVAFCMPIAWSWYAGDGMIVQFAEAAALTLAIGLALWLPTRRIRRELQARDACVLVVLAWVLTSGVSAMALTWTIHGLSWTDAYFEAVAGLTTTGSTVLTGLERLPQSVNLWRHELQWLGGMGIIVLAIAVLPMIGIGGMQLFRSEMPGPMKEGKITPRIEQTARYLYVIYTTLTLLCIALLYAAGLSLHDAICHGFATVSLGGFSTYDASISAFDSPWVETIMAVFMLLSVLNYTTHYTAYKRRSLAIYLRDNEARNVLLTIFVSCLLVAVFLWWRGSYPDLLTSLRYATFNVISMATTAGFANSDFNQWPAFTAALLLALGVISCSSGSTGGGIKMLRAMILMRQAVREMLRLAHPRAVRPMMINGQTVSDRVILAVLGFMLLYGLTILLLSFLMMASGLDLVSALSGIIVSVNNSGPGLGTLGPSDNYAHLSDFQKWLCVFGMIAGRLELVTVYALLLPSFWRT